MRTAIQSLEIIKKMYEYFIKKYRDLEPNLMICEKEDFRNIEKSLKALEIIKEKEVVIAILIRSNTLDEYNNNPMFVSKLLTQEEYDILKEVLL